MRTFAPKQKPNQDAKPASFARPGRRSIENHTVEPLLQAHAQESPTGALLRITQDFSRISVHAPARTTLQPKLQVNTPGDVYEKQAEWLAEQVMLMPEPQLQRTCACGGGYPKCQNEQASHEHLQTDRVQANDYGERAALPIVQEVPGSSGQPLDSSTRSFMEPRFGHDFSRVRVHIDVAAAAAASALAARAFTINREIVFGAGEYAPSTKEGRHLLAHELTHVIQQGRAPLATGSAPAAGVAGPCSSPQIQRRIVIGGTPYTPTAAYESYLRKNFGNAMVEFISHMHNGGKAPDYAFASDEEMGREVRIRAAAIKGMEEEVQKGCCGYPPAGNGGNLDPTYWDKKGTYRFVVKSPMPTGKQPSDALEAIFKRDAGTLLECNSMTVAIQYRAMLKMLGPVAFNKKFPGGAGLIISPHHEHQVPPFGGEKNPIFSQGLYKEVPITSSKDLMPGDWVYFKNVDNYIDEHPGGLWSGEHTLYLGNGLFQGFGITKPISESDLDKKLREEYNKGLSKPKQTASVPGLQNYARRPIISQIDK